MKCEVAKAGNWHYYHAPALTEAGLLHGFCTKSSSALAHDHRGREDFTAALALTRSVIMDQVHGDEVHIIQQGETPEKGDGLILVERGVAAIIKTADCLPIILFDSSVSLAAIVHAGWKGTVARIAARAVDGMVSLGAKRERIEAVIGPGIGPCCYEIKDDVGHIFREAGFSPHMYERGEGAVVLDLKGVNREILQAAGIELVYDLGLCTSCRQDLFFSARKNGTAGRQINFIALP
jgi:hypothetical protein